MLKGQKGITLVALVVTIIVLIILAGVSIALVLGDNGVITKAKEGANAQAAASTNETHLMNQVTQYAANELYGF